MHTFLFNYNVCLNLYKFNLVNRFNFWDVINFLFDIKKKQKDTNYASVGYII